MQEKYNCFVFDPDAAFVSQIANDIQRWNIFSSIESFSEQNRIRMAYKESLVSNACISIVLIIGVNWSSKEMGVVDLFRHSSAQNKIFLLRDNKSPAVDLDNIIGIDVVELAGARFLNLRVKLSEFVEAQITENRCNAEREESQIFEDLGEVDPFRSGFLAKRCMKMVQRLEILLRSQSGTKIGEKILPRFLLGKLGKEVAEDLQDRIPEEALQRFRKHFESAVVDWNRSLKRISLEEARVHLLMNIISFDLFSAEVRNKFEQIYRSKVGNRGHVEDDACDVSADVILPAIGQGLAELDNFWEELWKDVDMTDLTPTTEVLLENRVKAFVVRLFGSLTENELVREFRLYFEKHLLQWYKDTRTMSQEQASALLRKRILSFPALPNRVVKSMDSDNLDEESQSFADLIERIVHSLARLGVLFTGGFFDLDSSGALTNSSDKELLKFVDEIFIGAPSTIRIEEFRSYFFSSVRAWVYAAHKSGLEEAYAGMRERLRAFYSKF